MARIESGFAQIFAGMAPGRAPTAARRFRLCSSVSMAGLALAGAALALPGQAYAQTLDLGGASVARVDFDQTPGVPYTQVTNGTLLLNDIANLTYAGALDDSLGIFSFRKQGNFATTLTGAANTYTGETRISGGTLVGGAANAFSANSVVNLLSSTLDLGGFSQTIGGVTGNGVIANTSATAADVTFLVNSGTVGPFFGTITQTSGVINVIKSGLGEQFLANASNYTGSTILTAGRLTVGNSAALGTSTVFLFGGTLAVQGTGINIANQISLAASANFSRFGNPSILSGTIGGPGGLTYDAGGSVAVTGINTYSGGTTINGGEIVIGNDAAFGTGVVTVGQITLFGTTGAHTVANDFVLNAQARFNLNDTLALTGVVSGTDGIWLQSGTGTLQLDNANTYSGGTLLTSGTLAVGDNAALGTGALLVLSSARLTPTVNGLDTGNAIGVAPLLNVDTQGFDYTLSGTIFDFNAPGTLLKSGLGTLTLSGTNSYSGGTQISDGTVAFADDAALGSTAGAVSIDGGILQYTGVTESATSRGIVLTGGGGAIDVVSNAGTYTVAGVVSGPGTLVKQGNGVLTLAGANTYSGGTTVNGGTLAVGSDGALGTGTATINGTTFAAAADVTIANDIAFNGAAVNTNAFNATLNGVVGGTNFTKTGSGTLTLNNNANTVSSGISIIQGTIAVGANGALGPSNFGVFAGTTLQAAAPGLTIANAIDLVGGPNTTFDTQANILTLTGPVSFNGPPVVLDKVGSGTLVVSGTFSADPIDTVNVVAGTLQLDGTIIDAVVNVASGATISGNGSTTGASTTTIADGGILSPGTGTGNVGVLTFSNLVLNDASILNFDLGQAGVVGGVSNDLVNVTNALTLDGILNVNAAPTFTGGNYTLFTYGSVVDNGLQLGAIPGGFTGSVVVGGGAVVLAALGPAVQYWDGSGAIADGVISGGSGTWNSSNFNWTDVTGAFNTTWNNQQAIFGTVGGAVSVVGPQQFNSLVFTADGYVLTGDDLVASAPGEISVSAALTTVINNNITGASSITKQGDGNLALNGNNSFTDLGISAGTVTLGSNTAAGVGGISMAGGTTLASGVSGLVIGNLISTAGAGTVNVGAGDFTLANTIFGPGSITKTGSGNLVLNGANSFNNLGISAGRVTLGTNTAAGIGGISLGNGTTLAAGVSGLTVGNAISTAGAGSIDSGAGVFTLNGLVSGPGSITQIGSGNLVLNGNNSFGDLGIKSGTVTVGTNTAGGLGGISIGNGGTLAAGVSGLVLTNAAATAGAGTIDSGAGIFTLNGPIAGPGSITKTGAGNLALNGNNSFTNLGISAGTVTVGTNTAAGNGGISMAGGTSLAAGVSGLMLGNAISTAGAGTVNAGAGIFTLNGPILGPGSITKTGTGNLVLNGNSSFNNLGISSGTVTLGSNTAAGSGGISMAAGTTLAAGAAGLVVANPISTAGAGTIDSSTFMFTLGGPISGPGSITKVGTGNLVLNGANSFTNLGISTGTVTLGTNTAAGIGGISLANGTTLAAGANVTIANPLSTAGAGTLDSGAFVFTVSNTIFGPGSITKTGSGNLVLNGNNSFTNLGISAGTVTVGTNGAAGLGGISLSNGTTLAAGVSGLVYNQALSTAGAGTIDSGPGLFTYAGVIVGPGSITKAGTGNLALFGNNTFGDLGIKAGTVTVYTNTAAGLGGISIANGGTLAAGVSGLVLTNAMATAGAGTINSGAGVFTLNGPIAGPGSITKTGTGNLALNGNNSFVNLGISMGTVTVGTNTAAGAGGISMAGGTTLAAGVSGLVLGNAVSTAGAGVVNSGAGIFTLNGPILGPGSITKTGAGTLVLNGNNSFTNLGITTGNVTVGTNTAAGNSGISMAGGTRLTAGVSGLVLANGVSTAGAGEIDSGTGIFTLNGPIVGPGSLTQVGLGTLVLNGNNSFANAGIKSGTLAVGSNTALGVGGLSINGGATLAAAANNLTLANAISTAGSGTVNTAAFNLTLAGPISGPGSIVKTGTGTLTFTGVDTYTGATTVTAGRLNVNGSLTTSAVTVGSGGTLGGTGSIASLIATSGSTVNPGVTATPALLTVTGNATFQVGSTFAVDVTPTTADRLNVGGAASLNGTLLVNTSPGFYTGTQYTILSATGGRTGTFGTVTGVNGAFAPTVVYTANTVLLSVRPKSLLATLGTGGTRNQTNVAAAFDVATSTGFDPSAFAPLFALGTGLPGALDQISGELHSVERRVAMDDTRYVREAALDRLGNSLDTIVGPRDGSTSSERGEHKITLWGRGIGSWGDSDSDGNGSSFSKNSVGGIAGFDYSFDGGKIGAFGSYIKSDIDDYALGQSKVESTGGGVYAGYRKDHGLAAVIGGSAAGIKARGNRSVTIPGLAQNLASRSDGTVYQAFFDVSYDLAAGATSRVEPFVKFAWVALDTDAFTETGGIAALVSRPQSYDTNVTTAGLRGSLAMGAFGGFAIKASAGAQYTGGDRSPAARLALTGTNSPASIYAVGVDKWAFAGELSGEVRLAPSATFALGYSGVNGKRVRDNGVRGTLTFGF